MKKIKNFKCDKINPEGLRKVENDVNDFLKNHDIIDIKVTSCCNQYGSLLMYVIIYSE